jgi:predicted metal-dependent phosphoesterase TrpH
MTIDLHTHTAFSDGTDQPDEWMAAARAQGVTTLAITDHDTTDGWQAAVEARLPEVTLVRGAELSTHVVHDGRRYSVHLLAYLFDPADRRLAAELARLRADRLERGLAMVDRMVAAGLPISRQQVLDIADAAPVGRPHIGRVLMAAGLVSSVTEAFATYLSGRGPYYVSKADTALMTAIGLVRGAGGVPVLAHPRSRGAAAITDEAMIRSCVDAGLAGIEVDHPDHSPDARADLRRLADRFGLIRTGASDYHGSNKAVRIGQDTSDAEAVRAIVSASSGATPLVGPEPR